MLYDRQCARHFKIKGHIKVLRNKEKVYISIIFYFYFNRNFGEGHSEVGLIMDKMSCFRRHHSKKKDLNAFLSPWFIIWHRFISLLGTLILFSDYTKIVNSVGALIMAIAIPRSPAQVLNMPNVLIWINFSM